MVDGNDSTTGGRLRNKVAVIIGGATGFGLATAERFAEEGATVVIGGRRADLADEVGSRLGGWGMTCDVTDHDQVAALADAVVERHDTLDVGMNCAGYAESTAIADLTPATLGPMVDVQFTGAVWAIKHFCNAMVATGGGSMISISSLTAHNPSVGHAAYAGAKAGLEYVTRIAAVEYGPSNVRVNTVAAHMIETPMTRAIFDSALVVEAVRLQTPLGRLGDVSDIANCALYLASDESGYVSGETIRVDGAANTQKLPGDAEYSMLATVRPELT